MDSLPRRRRDADAASGTSNGGGKRLGFICVALLVVLAVVALTGSEHLLALVSAPPADDLFEIAGQRTAAGSALAPWRKGKRAPTSAPGSKPAPFDRSAPVIPIDCTLAVLEYNTPLTLNHTLSTYASHGLFRFFRQSVVFLQKRAEARAMTRREEAIARRYGLDVWGTRENRHVGFALREIVMRATTEYVLFLEKDFALVEGPERIAVALEDAVRLLSTGAADVVRLRSRRNPGAPEFSELHYKGKEDTVFDKQRNLLCNFYHFIPRPEERWPQHFRHCAPGWYCVASEYCNWTNNPVIFRRDWWLRNIARWVDARQIMRPPHENHNFEATLNVVPEAWAQPNYTIALGRGLFSHMEIDG